MSSKVHPVNPIIWLARVQEKREDFAPIRFGAEYRFRSAANAPRFNAASLPNDFYFGHSSWLTELQE
jgi:hypothetical protein